METIILPIEDGQAIQRALEVLQAGGLVAFPTDTVYGVGVLISNAPAIERIYAVKGRETTKAIPVLLGGMDQLEQVSPGVGEKALRLAQHFWPGPLTLVVPRRPELPQELSNLSTVGVRVPDHPGAIRLIQQSGPLATTSANRSGNQNPLTAQDVFEQLGGKIELILDGGKTPGGTPSTVVDCTGPEPVILRLGPLTEEMIKSIF
jgi:L-threonylcarbamoyladenylate synthase